MIATVAAGPAVNAIEAVALLIGRVAPGTPRDMAAALGAAIHTMRHLTVLLRLGPALWAAVAPLAAGVVTTARGLMRALQMGAW